MSLLTMSAQLAEGFLITVEIFVLTLLFSLPLGLTVAFGRMSGCKVIRIISKIYISIMRGTPLMLQIIVVYFAPFYVFRMQVGTGYRFPAVILAFVINYAAYFAEIYRAGIESIPVGQYEAAEVLGYSKAQTFVKIILPQVVKRVLPPVTNETITLVKDTSMAFTIPLRKCSRWQSRSERHRPVCFPCWQQVCSIISSISWWLLSWSIWRRRHLITDRSSAEIWSFWK